MASVHCDELWLQSETAIVQHRAMISTLAIANYRSLRNIVAPLDTLNLVSGENGSGKSSLYRALRLLADTAQGGVVASIAREGGLSARRPATRRCLGFASDELSYCIDRKSGAGRANRGKLEQCNKNC